MKVEILKQKGHKFLWIDNYLWMWDLVPERKLQKDIADQAYGDVLVAGYGLGIVQKFLTENKKVNLIVTIEKNPDVIDACKKEYGITYGSVNCEDFYKYTDDVPLTIKYKWDCVIGDIWDDIVPEQLDNYKKFKKKALTLLKPNGEILAWGKEYFEYLIEKENQNV